MSDLFSVGVKDFLKGLIVAVLSSVLVVIYQVVQAGSLVFDYKAILLVAISSALGYIIKNYFSDSEGRFLGKV